MTSYQPGIPTGLVDLDIDYQNIQGNFQQLDTTYGTDHVAFSVAANNGYHKAIRLVPQAAPTTVPSVGQLFDTTVNDGIANDTSLFFKTGTGILQKLTMNFAPVAASPGYTFLPGGILVNWGSGNFIHGSNISFPKSFPNAVFNIQLTANYSAQSRGTWYVDSSKTTKDHFQVWTLDSSGSSISTSLYWMAIGN